MFNKESKVKSENQSGGITANTVINHNAKQDKGLWANPIFKYIVIPILIGILILGLSIGANKMFGKDKAPSEVYHVESNNQNGGVTAGKIEKLNLITISNKNDSIQSIFLEAKLTVSKKENTEIPPSEVKFYPIGDSHAYFENNEEKVRLEFQSPVNFLQNDNGDIIIINKFTLQRGSILQNKPLNYLSNFESLLVPIVTIVWGNSFDKIKLLEISLKVNGNEVWKKNWKYDDKFKTGPTFSIPLK